MRENKDYMLTPYGLIKEGLEAGGKLNLKQREMSYFFEYNNFISGMFVYDNLPDTVDENFLEMYLQGNGTVGWTKNQNDELVVIRGGRYGGPGTKEGSNEGIGNYGLGKWYLGSNDNPETGSISFEIGKDGVIGYNNATMSPDFDANFYAFLLTEIDKSLIFNIRYSRLAPIFKAGDSKKKKAIEELLNDIDDGKMVNVISDELIEELEGGGSDVLQLTDVKEVDKIQYLIKAREDVIRMYHTKYGLSEKGSGKLAQQTVDEVNGSASSSFALALEMLYYRRIMVEDVNAMWGTNIVVNFSPAWDVEYKKFITQATPEDNELIDDSIAAVEGTEETGEDSAQGPAEGPAEGTPEESTEKEGAEDEKQEDN